jgi:hypothetical protein
MPITSVCEERMEDSFFTNDRSRVRKQNYQSWDWCTPKTHKAPGTTIHPSATGVTALTKHSFGTLQELNASAPYLARTTEALRALFWSTTLLPIQLLPLFLLS